MKLKRIYANKQFKNILFNEGLNVIIGCITNRLDREKDTHNLGKTTLIHIIDFLLLKDFSRKKSFLANEIFNGQVFYAELVLNNGEYLVIRRSIDTPSKISFKKSFTPLNDFATDLEWDFENLSFDKAKSKLNEYLSFDVLTKWEYRKSINYFLRTQDDFKDVFKLSKFLGAHSDWKPVVFELLGYDSTLISEKYNLDKEQERLKVEKETIKKELNVAPEQKDKIKGALSLKRDEREVVASYIDKFNFYEQDQNTTSQLIEGIDSKIQTLNSFRYSVEYEINKITTSLQMEQSVIDVKELRKLYEEVEVYFPDTLLKEYEQLLNFNKAITFERRKYLAENLKKLQEQLKDININLYALEKEKEEKLSFLINSDSYYKFKRYQEQLSKIDAEIVLLKHELDNIDITDKIETEKAHKEQEAEEKVRQIKELIGEEYHAEIRRIFNRIIQKVLNVSAIISIIQNSKGNIDFSADCQNNENLAITSEGYGTTYKKLLCMAFDLSILMFYSINSFFRFVYHDGALEGLDDRKKRNFIEAVRKIVAENDVQYIFTLIDSDLPKDEKNNVIYFDNKEVVLELNDRDDSGKLFLCSF